MNDSAYQFPIAPERLAHYGQTAARSLLPSGICSGRAAARAIRDHLRRLKQLHITLQRRAADTPPSKAGEWMLDNWYLAVREGNEAARSFHFAKSLPAVKSMPRVLFLAEALLRSGQGSLDTDRLRRFLEGAQRDTPLTQAELGLFVPALTAAALRALVRLYQEPSPDGDAAGRLFSTLRLLGTADLSALLEQADCTDRTLREDPAGVYPVMADSTRAEYRRRVAELAKQTGKEEFQLARQVLKLARQAQEPQQRHVGYWLYPCPLGRKAVPRRGTVYFSAFFLSTLLLSLLPGILLDSPAAAVLLLIPVSEVVKNLMDFLLTRHIRPRHVPRLELADGIPPEGKTLCVVSTLLTGESSGPETARQLEQFFLCNRDSGEHLLFGILADLPEGSCATQPEDSQLLFAAKQAIDALNRKYGDRFYLFYRERAYNARDKRYRGKERKRGALLALAQFLQGMPTELILLSGEAETVRGAPFLLTLDADTRLCPGTARELVGAMLHPLNHPVADPKTGVVQAGYGLLHPRISTDLSAATATEFSRIFSGQGGLDPYQGNCGELYMDLFDRGGFAGKGILSVEMLLRCARHLPEDRILSHDALEGAYLHGGFLGDVELTDGFPADPLSYLKRLERWTRGDWQNAPWIFSRRGRALSGIDRLKLLDSLRRSLVAPATFLCLLSAFFLPHTGPVVAAWAACIALLSRLLLTLAADSVRPDQERKIRYHSAVLHGVKGAVLNTGVRFLFLPWEAAVTLCAIGRALWRMGVSHRNLLSWQTFAQSGGGKRFRTYLTATAPCTLTGLALLLFSEVIFAKALGVIWLTAPVFAWLLSRPHRGAPQLSASDKRWLIDQAAQIWQFFQDFCTAEEHYLPPDNVQEQPPKGAAHRTSPTNIGLAMTSALTAADLGLDGQLPGETLIERILTTLEQLPKWHGHIYNWYDTQTLTPLHPRYISTVDSGNLAACLVAVTGGMRAYGREDLAQRAQALFQAMDFRPLYDARRHLFHIGMDLETMTLSDSRYDLLSSEARLTSFVAIAKGDVPRRHWRRLSRALVARDGYRGMVSWTGSMFEYLMPELFLPLIKDSLLDETARFCVYVQRRRVPRGHPWGISESAYPALDPAMNYRYKAHGCGALALRRGMDRELVISPYSSFLALAVTPRAAVKNLRQLERRGLSGTYGFYEAVDFTPSRCRMTGGEPVRCYMAHHLGMSMTAIGNCLRGNANVRRFLSEPAMAAHQCLLEEKIPIGGTVLRRHSAPPPSAPRRKPTGEWTLSGGQIDWALPACCLLSNGNYTLLADETGQVETVSQDVTIYAPGSAGLSVCLGREVLPLTPAVGPQRQDHWQFSGRAAVFSCQTPAYSANITLSVAPGERGEVRTVELLAKQAIDSAALQFRLQPILAFTRDFQAHPAYCRLGLHAEQAGQTLLLSRAPRGALPALYLAISASLPMTMSPAPGDLPDPTLTLTFPFRLAAGERLELKLALCTAPIAAQALQGSQRLLFTGQGDSACLPVSAAALLEMEPPEVTAAMALLPLLRRPRCVGPIPGKRSLLWQYGISGDLPILAAHLTSKAQLPAAVSLIKRHGFLDLCGIRHDLVLLCAGAGDYQQPTIRFLESATAQLSREFTLGSKGGVHLLPDSEQALADILPFAARVLPLDGTEERIDRSFHIPVPTAACDPRENSANLPTFYWQEEGAFSFTVTDSLPPRTWSLLLTNGSLGYLATDAGIGHLWMQNAGLLRLTPWHNDPTAVTGSERLDYIPQNGAPISLFAANDGLPCRVTYGFGWASWEKTLPQGQVTLTAFLPPDTDARVFWVRSTLPGGVFRWQAALQLGEHAGDAACVKTGQDGPVLTARNPACVLPDMTLQALSEPPFQRFTCSADSARMGQWDSQTGWGLSPCFAMEIPAESEVVLVCGTAERPALTALTDVKTAAEALERTRAHWSAQVRRLTVETPDLTANRAMNGWAVYQALAGRLLGRSSLYQAGGAYGFRDQLQDAVNLLLIDPALPRNMIPLCCARQYTQGDVQHWWHLPEGRGVRTRCSDDLLWLPWAVCEYVEKTGDTGLLQEEIPYLDSPPLTDSEQDRYELALPGDRTGTVLEHAQKALDLALARGSGPHGLLRMLGGDWNDGFGSVGKEGIGESVWLTWFFSQTAQRFGQLLETLNMPEGETYRRAARQYGAAADRAWDGSWYLRGWYDDGSPLGSKDSAACQIDSIAQSWAVMNPFADQMRKITALESALNRLFLREQGLVKLFDPPIPPEDTRAGYISGYGPGFRENGGQYTHAALWLAQACFRSGRSADGHAILQALWPALRDISVFQAEPFVIPADVSTNPNAMGRCGWTWYTGSAGWYFRVFTEELLGLRLRDGTLTVSPCLPPDWTGYTATLTDTAGNRHTIAVRGREIEVDGAPADSGVPVQIIQKDFINNPLHLCYNTHIMGNTGKFPRT